MSLVNTARGGTPPVFTTVYCDRTKSVARAAGVDERRVLGYAIAHELGHLLLDTPGHSASGLMRAWWSAAELRRNTSADWGFDATAAGTVRSAAETRTAMR
jgi:hypothetical protein